MRRVEQVAWNSVMGAAYMSESVKKVLVNAPLGLEVRLHRVIALAFFCT